MGKNARQLFETEGVEITEGEPVSTIRLTGYNELVGFIDLRERVVYLPCGDDMNGRLSRANIPSEQFADIMQRYLDLGRLIEKNEFRRRHIVDS
ncbi:MAG: hypothetical protein KJ600_02665 [Nanoarchaeota archaeon]|nr:hypothetical protein [Nanoarchaeota archaeon]